MATKKIKELNYEKNQYLIKLHNTDYMAIKFAEGAITAEEYASMKAQREAWRANIRYLENEVEYLKKQR